MATPELRDAAAMLLEGAQGCGSARNASPCKLPRSSRSEMLEYDAEAYLAVGEDQPCRRLTKDKDRILLPRNTQARLEMLGPVGLATWAAAHCGLANLRMGSSWALTAVLPAHQ